ncbi:MAG TPA: hypothetical protein DCP31_15130 [Cyanobacteria bacterium UBA8543]|nr:hypothetical protein [Cyanobacteria bacterium UBA8543]
MLLVVGCWLLVVGCWIKIITCAQLPPSRMKIVLLDYSLLPTPDSRLPIPYFQMRSNTYYFSLPAWS